jgi:SAM-dependent methyltransferase
MSKQAEKEYPHRIEPWHLYTKPYDCPRTFREFGLALDVLRAHVPLHTWVLDLGCGPGWTSIFLQRAGWGVVGVDISERMIEIARERAASEGLLMQFVVADMEELDLQKRDVQAALLFDSLHHCPNYPAVLQRAWDHLAPGGCLLLMEPSWLHLYSPHARETTRVYGVTELGFSRGSLRRLLRKIGFRSVHCCYDAGPSFGGLGGFLLANVRLWCSYLFYYPQIKQILLARK